MSPIIAVLFLIGVASATETYDCGPANKIIAINKALITPDPVPYPGEVSVDTEMEVLKDIPSDNFVVKLDLVKLEGTEKLPVDCINGLGSCEYDVCSYLLTNNKKAFEQLGMTGCPIMKKKYATPNLAYTIKSHNSTTFGQILEGNFEGKMTFKNKADNTVYGCLGMKFSIKNNMPASSTAKSA